MVWILTSSARALERWGNHHRYMLSEERTERCIRELAEGAEGFKLYPELETQRAPSRTRRTASAAA